MLLFKNILTIFVTVLLSSSHLVANDLPCRSVDSYAFASIKDLDDKLIEAIINVDAKAVKALLAAGANTNAKADPDAPISADYKSKGALRLAAIYGNADIVKALIAEGADLNGVDNWLGYTALHLAAEKNNADIVEVLITAGANIEAEALEQTPLIVAASGKACFIARDDTLDAVRVLIVGGANVNAATSDGVTALMEAATHNNFKTVRTLILAGADINATDSQGNTALDFASRYNAYEAYNTLNYFKKKN